MPLYYCAYFRSFARRTQVMAYSLCSGKCSPGEHFVGGNVTASPEWRPSESSQRCLRSTSIALQTNLHIILTLRARSFAPFAITFIFLALPFLSWSLISRTEPARRVYATCCCTNYIISLSSTEFSITFLHCCLIESIGVKSNQIGSTEVKRIN